MYIQYYLTQAIISFFIIIIQASCIQLLLYYIYIVTQYNYNYNYIIIILINIHIIIIQLGTKINGQVQVDINEANQTFFYCIALNTNIIYLSFI